MAEEEGVSQASHVSSTQGTQGQCPTCWRSIFLTKDGKIRVHGPISNRCPGSKKTPNYPGPYLPADPSVDSSELMEHTNNIIGNVINNSNNSDNIDSPLDVLQVALIAANNMQLQDKYHSMEKECVNSIMESCFTMQTCTISHVPKSCRPSLAKILKNELKKACTNIWGAIRLCMFAKAVLRLPPRGGKRHRHILSSTIQKRIDRWQNEGIVHLWNEALSDTNNSYNSTSSPNLKRALFKAREGHFGKAIQALQSLGASSTNNIAALNDLIRKHPQHHLPEYIENIPPTLSVSTEDVLASLKCFPKGSSPGGTKFRIQHLCEAIYGTTAPVAQECLVELTKWINLLLSGKFDKRLAPWIGGAPLTALNKKNNDGFRPIAVGDVFRRLISRLCCASVYSRLPETLIPKGQFGVGVRGGMEALIHSTKYILAQYGSQEDMCILKVDFTNAFNECSRQTFLNQIKDLLPQLFGWIQWCYTVPGELRFGQHRILSSAGVQQGDPLSPLLFSMTLCKLLDQYEFSTNLLSNWWYLDDGVVIGTRNEVNEFLTFLLQHGRKYGLKLNLNKCELF